MVTGEVETADQLARLREVAPGAYSSEPLPSEAAGEPLATMRPLG